MKKIHLLLFIIITIAFLITVTPVFAQNTELDGILSNTVKSAGAAGYDPVGGSVQLVLLTGRIVAAFLSLIGIIFISYTVYGGYLWMTAAGNEEKMTKAKAIIRNGIIGLIVTFSAAAIYYFVITIFGGSSDSGQLLR